MTPYKLLLVLGLSAAACQSALAQEVQRAQDAQHLAGGADCRFGFVYPTAEAKPAQGPAWDGGCKAGFADGKGTLAWSDSAGKHYSLEASLAAGQVAGEGKLRLPGDAVYIGTFTDAFPNGHGYYRYANGSRYEGDIRMGKRSGSGEMLYADGNTYKGEWKNGKRDGTGVLTYILGGRYEGKWANNKPAGEGKMVFAGTPGRELAVIDGNLPARPAAPVAKANYTLKEESAHTGTLLRHDAAINIPVPPTLAYDKLSPDEQDIVKRQYAALAPGDEPPYPLGGPASFYRTVQRIVSLTRQQGSIYVYVLVGKDGKPESVTAIGLEDADVRKAVSMAAGVLKYKPAVCDGQPCEMMFPYRLALTMGQ